MEDGLIQKMKRWFDDLIGGKNDLETVLLPIDELKIKLTSVEVETTDAKTKLKLKKAQKQLDDIRISVFESLVNEQRRVNRSRVIAAAEMLLSILETLTDLW
ncbi:MAG: hypothetical protein PHG14_14255 [Desulfobacter postgatei]|uniref:hypothetical protein n=1 Tax=Desulfobacter postgatei TaxID=2293 RepID=UPI0023F45189|nr:hypothetical protein [Desulfobacter postgatei]MDD4274874.1 hypothetical protein [Desulfobacter postgatei]